MKTTLALAATLLLAAAGPSAAQSVYPEIRNGQIVAPLQALTIYVRNMDASLKLYRDILKLHVVSDTRAAGGERTVHLAATNQPVGHIYLISLGAKGGVAPPPLKEPYGHSGDFAVVMNTNDIWNLYDKLVAERYQVMSPPVTLMQNPNMRVQGVEMSFRDPDGAYVNLIQSGTPN